MDTRMKLQMERATRVIGFSREHPSDLPGYQSAVSRLEARLTRTRKMAEQQISGRLEGKGAVADRGALGRLIVADLQLLAGIARTAGVESAGTPLRIRYPGPHRNQVHFLSAGRVAVAEAAGEEEQLKAAGLPADHLATLASRLDQFEALMGRRDEAARSRMAARQEFRTLSREMGLLVEQLHTINRHRFLADSATFAVWRSIRHLPVGARKTTDAAPASLPDGAVPLTLPPGPAA